MVRVKIRVWDPPEEFTKNGLRPVHVNLHGSGYVVRTFGTDSDFCERLANELGIHVLDCDYAKGMYALGSISAPVPNLCVGYLLQHQSIHSHMPIMMLSMWSITSSLKKGATICPISPLAAFLQDRVSLLLLLVPLPT